MTPLLTCLPRQWIRPNSEPIAKVGGENRNVRLILR